MNFAFFSTTSSASFDLSFPFTGARNVRVKCYIFHADEL